MQTFTIGRWSVTLNGSGYSVAKDNENVFTGDVKSILNKYDSCFNRMKPNYTIASVCLEDAIIQMSR